MVNKHVWLQKVLQEAVEAVEASQADVHLGTFLTHKYRNVSVPVLVDKWIMEKVDAQVEKKSLFKLTVRQEQ
jgi:hypothetical protein